MFMRHPLSAPQVRHFINEGLEGWGTPAIRAQAVLLVGELMRYTIMRTGPEFEVSIDRQSDSVLIAVGKDGAQSPHVADQPEAVPGRVRWLVEAFADSWDVEPSGDGWVVRLELEPLADPS